MTVYNGINIKSFTRYENPSLTKESFGFSDNDFVLIYSGRLNKEKGISQLIDAMLELDDLPNIKLMILGSTFFADASYDNSFVCELKEKASPIKERIIFTGFVPYAEMPSYLQLADIAVIPSIWPEPFGLTVIEAQAMGLATISTPQGGIPEIVSAESSIIIPVDDSYVHSLADAIRQLYHNPQKRTDMALAARCNAVNYNKERYSKDFFNALTSHL
jgi:glycosyltransferase involved in cell wall biosynthesis